MNLIDFPKNAIKKKLSSNNLKDIFFDVPLKTSRNTIICKIQINKKTYICKYNKFYTDKTLLNEYIYLKNTQDIKHQFFNIKIPDPLIYCKKYKYLVLEYFDYPSSEEILTQSLNEKKYIKYIKTIVNIVKVLKILHDNKVVGDLVELYCDYSPKNILIKSKNEFILIDPPEEKKIGKREIDIAILRFELFRISVKTKNLLILWKHYFKVMNWIPIQYDKDRYHNFLFINKAEINYCLHVIGRYLKFYKYNDVLNQLCRGICFVPILVFHILILVINHINIYSKSKRRWS